MTETIEYIHRNFISCEFFSTIEFAPRDIARVRTEEEEKEKEKVKEEKEEKEETVVAKEKKEKEVTDSNLSSRIART